MLLLLLLLLLRMSGGLRGDSEGAGLGLVVVMEVGLQGLQDRHNMTSFFWLSIFLP